MIRIGVTGTDTGVGKSVVSAAILALLRRQGLRVAGMKPVETGLAPADESSDAHLLRAAAGGGETLKTVRPILLPEPLAPWTAAERAGTSVNLELLDSAFERISQGRDAVLVEGAGGLRVPFTRDVAFDDLLRRWALEVVVVAGNRLGVINHTRLTVESAQRAGLVVRGVVLNALSPEPGLAESTNLATLEMLLPDLPVVAFPWVNDPRDPETLADAGEAAGLGRVLPMR